MILGLSQFEPTTVGQVTTSSEPIWSHLGSSIRMGDESSMQRQSENLAEDIYTRDASEELGLKKLSPDELAKDPDLTPLPGLTFDQPEYKAVAQLRHERHQKLLDDLYFTENIPSWGPIPNPASLGSWLNFGANMVGAVKHPMDLLAMMTPVVGWEAKAAKVAAEGGALVGVRAAMARGIMEASTLPLAEKFPRLIPSIVQNSAQQLVIQTPHLVNEFKDTGHIDTGEFAENIVGGAIAAEVLHYGLHLMGKMGGFLLKQTEPRTGVAMQEKAANDVLSGKDVDVSDNVKQDPNVIRTEAAHEEIVNRAQMLGPDESVKAAAEGKLAKLEALLEEPRNALEKQYREMGLSKEASAEAAKEAVRFEIQKVEAQAQATVDQVGHLGSVDKVTLQRIAGDYLDAIGPNSTRAEKIQRMLDTVKNGDPRERIALAEALGLRFDPNPRPKDPTWVETLVEKDPITKAVKAVVFDEPRIAKVVQDVTARDQRLAMRTAEIGQARVRDFMARQHEAIRQELAQAKTKLAEGGAAKTPLERLVKREPTLDFEPATPDLVPEKDIEGAPAAFIQKGLSEVMARLKEGLTEEEKAYIKGEPEEPTSASVISDGAKEVVESAVNCLLKNT